MRKEHHDEEPRFERLRIPAPEDEQSDPLAGLAAVMAAWRGLALDLPLVWIMELSRFGNRELEQQSHHWIRLTGCNNFRAIVEEQGWFARESAAELEEEAGALAREARIVVVPD